MKIGWIGLGRMGMNMALKLTKDGHEIVAWNRSYEKTESFVSEGGRGVSSVEDLLKSLETPIKISKIKKADILFKKI